MGTKKKVLQKATAMILVFVMTIANFVLVGEEVIAIAEAVVTNNRNVEITAYFQDTNGEQVTAIDGTIDQTDLKLIMEVEVKNEEGLGGYFDGTIMIEDANFKVIDEEEISIHVNAGSTVTIEREIEYQETATLTEAYLNKESRIVINGTYTNSESEYEISGETTVTVNWKTPEDTQAVLATKVLTNEEYQINEESKRIVQLLIGSKLSDNAYPVRSTVIKVNVPEGVEEVKVHKRTLEATNGDQEFSEDDYTYENGVLTIIVENSGNEISWSRNAQDILVVTYKYPEGTDLTETEISANSLITTYDGTILTAESATNIEEDIDGIVTSSISVNESEIYKGKLYSGEDRNYNTTTQINIDNAEATEKIELEEMRAVYVAETEGNKEERDANITYTKTEISKYEFLNIFGEDGYITIKDQDGNVVANITNDSNTDDNGNIVINYDNVTALQIETSKPVIEGILRLNHEKTIYSGDYTRDEIEELTEIKEAVETRGAEETKTITLLETETKATLTVETASLSTTEEGQQLNLRVTLETDDESKDLYNSPEIKILLPEQIEVTGAKYRMLYGNGLETAGATVTSENGQSVITLTFEGEQTSYEGDAINGTIIDIVATVELDELAVTSTEEIKLQYTNENKADFVGEDTRTINIVAESSMIITNNAVQAGVETIGNDETKKISLETEQNLTEETISMQIINNEGTTISNVVVLGSIPTNEGNIELASSISANVDAQVYYSQVDEPTSDLSDSSNGWSETPTTTASSFLVLVDSLENAQSLALTYNLSIDEDLDYNIVEEASYAVTYANSQTEETVESSVLLLATGTVAEIETNIIATVGEDTLSDGDEVKAGEIINYEISITNDGQEDAEGVNITASIPDGMTVLEINSDYLRSEMSDDEEGIETDENTVYNNDYYLESDNKTLEATNVTIGVGETVTYNIIARVDTDITDNITVTTDVSIEYNDTTITETISHVLRSGTISIELNPIDRFETDILEVGYIYLYKISVKNITDSEQNDVQITLNKNDLTNITRINYTIGEEYIELDGENTVFTIESISSGETIEVYVSTVMGQPTENLTATLVSAIAEDSEGNTYRSNKISENVKNVILSAELNASISSGSTTGYVDLGEEITYTINVRNDGTEDVSELTVRDNFSDYLDLVSITLNGEECEYSTEVMYDDTYSILTVTLPLLAGESAEIVITGQVATSIKTEDILEVKNSALIYTDGYVIETDEIIYYLETITESGTVFIESSSDEDNYYAQMFPGTSVSGSGSSSSSGSGTGTSTGTSSGSTSSETSLYRISGSVWLDEDGDGSRDSGEELLEGITVYLVEISTNNVLETTTTSGDGSYTFSGLESGNYIVAFEYDTTRYIVTSYQADGVSENRNSDAVKSSMTINGETKQVAVTDSISLSSSMANIDLGLIENQVFDLDIEKFVSSITVSNSNGTTVYDQEDETTLAQVQIASSVLSGTNVVIEYTIRITNNGEIAGYVKNIVDYLPSSLSFSTSLNSDWYQSGEYIYNSSLSNTRIEPGESVDVTLIVTKTMTNSNTGLINNRVSIEDSYNTLGITDNDTSDIASADVIIGIQTGTAISYIILIITIIVIIGGVAYLVNKKILKEKIKI